MISGKEQGSKGARGERGSWSGGLDVESGQQDVLQFNKFDAQRAGI